jgi:hypothetical protein
VSIYVINIIVTSVNQNRISICLILLNLILDFFENPRIDTYRYEDFKIMRLFVTYVIVAIRSLYFKLNNIEPNI